MSVVIAGTWDSGIHKAPSRPVFLTETSIKLKMHSSGWVPSWNSNIHHPPCRLNGEQVMFVLGHQWDMGDSTVLSMAHCVPGLGAE